MEGATHFIECWKDVVEGICHQEKPMRLIWLDSSLKLTKLNVSATTYAIIYIKPKK